MPRQRSARTGFILTLTAVLLVAAWDLVEQLGTFVFVGVFVTVLWTAGSLGFG